MYLPRKQCVWEGQGHNFLLDILQWPTCFNKHLPLDKSLSKPFCLPPVLHLTLWSDPSVQKKNKTQNTAVGLKTLFLGIFSWMPRWVDQFDLWLFHSVEVSWFYSAAAKLNLMVLQQKLWMGKCVWIQDSNRAYQINLTLRNFFTDSFTSRHAQTPEPCFFLPFCLFSICPCLSCNGMEKKLCVWSIGCRWNM